MSIINFYKDIIIPNFTFIKDGNFYAATWRRIELKDIEKDSWINCSDKLYSDCYLKDDAAFKLNQINIILFRKYRKIFKIPNLNKWKYLNPYGFNSYWVYDNFNDNFWEVSYKNEINCIDECFSVFRKLVLIFDPEEIVNEVI